MSEVEKIIPIRNESEAAGAEAGVCQSREPFVLMVLGDSMLPEFKEGEVIVIDPEGLARDGSYVLAQHDGEYTFRQLSIQDEGWYLKPLNDQYPTVEIPGPDAVKGVITQKSIPGAGRKARKFYQ